MTFSPYAPATGLSAIAEWAALTTQILGTLEQSYDQIARPLRLWERNNLADLVASTPPQSAVGDSGLTREQVIARSVVFQSLLAWLQTPVTVGQDEQGQPLALTPLDLLSSR